MALCWEAARRDLYTLRPSPQRRAVLMNLSRRLCLAKIEQDTRPGGPGGRVPAPEEGPTIDAAIKGLAREWGADSIVVARARAAVRAVMPASEAAGVQPQPTNRFKEDSDT